MTVRVLVGTIKGAFLLESDRDRQDWKIEGPLFKGWKVTAAAQGADGDFLCATASDVYGPGIHRSRDLREWSAADTPPAYPAEAGFNLGQIWTLSPSHGRWFAGVDEAGMFRSDDGGQSWSLVEGLSGHSSRSAWKPGFGGLCCHSILSHPSDPDRLWCGISAVGVFRSEDGGRSWQVANEGVPVIIEDRDHPGIGYCVHQIRMDARDPDTIYRQDHVGMFRTKDGARSWERTENGLPSTFGFPLAHDRRGGQLFAVPLESDEYRIPLGGRLQVYRSRDGADSWQAFGAGLPGSNFYAGVLRNALATDHLERAGLYLGTTAGSLFVSADDGENWRELPGTFPRILCVEAFVEGEPWHR